MTTLPSDTDSQIIRLLTYLKQHITANTIELRRALDIPHPGGRICDLRRRGYQIITDLKPFENHPNIAHYTLEKESINAQ